jgi:heme exporter protein CcmD
MNHWTFVTAAYAVTIAATAGILIQSWTAMRRAERAAEALRRK